jgi:hypothetical protein
MMYSKLLKILKKIIEIDWQFQIKYLELVKISLKTPKNIRFSRKIRK